MKSVTRHLRYFVKTVLIMLMLTSIACTNSPSVIGKWEKITSNICDVLYPKKIEFFDDGTYIGDLPNWNGGKYSLVNKSRIKLDTTTGLGVYDFSISGKILTIRNDQNCEFKYRRID